MDWAYHPGSTHRTTKGMSRKLLQIGMVVSFGLFHSRCFGQGLQCSLISRNHSNLCMQFHPERCRPFSADKKILSVGAKACKSKSHSGLRFDDNIKSGQTGVSGYVFKDGGVQFPDARAVLAA